MRPLRSAGVSSTLDQDVEHETILIDRAPKPMLLAGDRDDDLIQMPFVAASRRALADLIGERLAELLPPQAHGLVGHANPARRPPDQPLWRSRLPHGRIDGHDQDRRLLPS